MAAMTTFVLFGTGAFGIRLKIGNHHSHSPQSASIFQDTLEKIDFSIPLAPISTSDSFSSLAGRKVLILYFSPTCSHCQEAIPQIEAFADEIREQGYETIAIAIQRSTREEVQDFIAKYRCRLPIYWDWEGKFRDTYNTKTLPTLFLVQSTGDYFRMDGFLGKPGLDQLRQNL